MKILLQIMFLVTPLLSFTQVDTVARLYTFGGANNDVAEEIEATSDGGYIVIGSTSSNSWGNTDGYLLKVDSNCTYQWSKALGGANNDWGYAIEETHDKGFIIALTSNSFGNGGYDAVLMKRDSLGNYQWKKTYGGNDWDFAYDVTQTYDSGYVFCGETYNNTQGYSDVWVVKTNLNGDTLWTRTVGGSLVDKGNSIIETSDSNIVVAGITNTTTDSTQIYLLKFSKNGVLQWDSIYGDSLYENANSVIETANGDYVIGGATNSYSPNKDTDYLLFRVDNLGNSIWYKYFGNPSINAEQEIFDIYEKPNGDFLNVGFTEEAGGGMKDATLFRITFNGIWGNLAPTYGNSDDDVVNSITIGKDGDICMAGYTNSFGNGINDVLIIRLDTIILAPDTMVNIFQDSIPLEITEMDIKDQIVVFPNPAKSHFNILLDVPINNLYLRINNILGELVEEKKINKKNTYFNSEKYKPGVYFIQIVSEEFKIYESKIIIY